MTRRNVKMFFKDKGMFFTSLITPAILLVLYATFLRNVYVDSFEMNLPASLDISKDITEGIVSGQLISSLLAVSCITVAFCSNFLIVQDKANGTVKDLTISPVRSGVLSVSYYAATLISTLIICFAATGLCLIYAAATKWYMSFSDVILLFTDVLLLVLFGTALSSIINYFLSSQGQISAVGTIVSAGYGFICGAYMPISTFDEGLQRVICLLPGTYGTALIRNHAMSGALKALADSGLDKKTMKALRDTLDCNIYFFNERVPVSTMYIVLAVSVAVLVAIYILLNSIKRKAR